MDKAFWRSLVQKKYAIPEGHSPQALTLELFSYLGNTDPELRDDIGYMVYANWLKRGLYSQADIESHIIELLANLNKGIGETETDSIFLRSFSVLALAEIIYNDNKAPRLEKAHTDEVLEKGLQYMKTEKDPRGHIPVKGWAHALAHTADLLLVLAKNEHTDSNQHRRILDGISAKLTCATDWIYRHGEDDRLSSAVLIIFQRGLLDVQTIETWLGTFNSPQDFSWKGAWTKDETTRAFFNVRNFLRSLYLQIETEEILDNKAQLRKRVLEAVRSLKTY